MVLHGALGQAERWGYVPRNVATLVETPRAPRYEIAPLNEEQSRAFLLAAKSERLEALFVVALTTGMRQGELLGLRWRDVELAEGSLQVRSTLERDDGGVYRFVEPKTARSRRRVTLTATAVTALRAHRAAQLKERIALGSAWDDLDLVFPNEVGRPLDPTNVTERAFRRTLRRAGLPRIRFHDLRHTAATLMLARNVHPKVASEMLGHAQVAITLDLYSHVTPTMQREAAVTMEAIVRGRA
jgi:integrase